MRGDEAGPATETDIGTDAGIERFVRSFEDCSFPRSAWTHERHLVMALWYLHKYPRDEATTRIREGIRRYNQSHGNLTGYHETITLAWVVVIADFLLARGDGSLGVSTLARLLIESCAAKDYLLRFYSKDVLLSEEARRRWLPPDRQVLRWIDPR